MSLASMKLKTGLQTSGVAQPEKQLVDVTMEVVAIHHHPDSRELNVHLRRPDAPAAGVVDLVLLADDMERALELVSAETLVVGSTFKLTLTFVPPLAEPAL